MHTRSYARFVRRLVGCCICAVSALDDYQYDNGGFHYTSYDGARSGHDRSSSDHDDDGDDDGDDDSVEDQENAGLGEYEKKGSDSSDESDDDHG